MRVLLGSALAAAFALTIGAASGRDDKDKKAIPTGTYLIVGMEKGGTAIPADQLAKAPEEFRTVKVTADKMVASMGPKESPAAYTLDTSKTPYQIDMTAKKDGKDETTYGIYKVDGDTLIICAVQSDKAADRPKEFKTSKDGKEMMMTLKLKK